MKLMQLEIIQIHLLKHRKEIYMRKRNSINSRLIFILLLCFLLPFLFQTTYVSGHLSRLIEDKVLNTTYKSLENSTLLFTNALQTQFDMVNFYKSDAQIVKAMGEMKDADDKSRYQLQQKVLARLVKDNSIEKYRYPFYFILIDYQGNMMTNFTYTPYGGYEEVYAELTESSWFHTLRKSYTDSTVMFSGSDFLNDRGSDKLYVASNVFDGENIGVLVFATDKSYLSSQFYDVLPEVSGFIVDEKGNCIAQSPDSQISYGEEIFQKVQELKQQLEDGGAVVTILEKNKGVQYAVLLKRIEIKGYPHVWHFISVVPVGSIMGEVEGIRMVSIAVLLFYLAAILGVILLLKKTIVNPIRSLCDCVYQVREGNLQVRIEGMPDNELEELGKGFNMMVENLNVSFQNLKKNEEKKRITEIKLLQNQIKPHFVRNVLNTIRWLAEINGVTSVSKSIMALSALLEYNFRDSTLVSTVGDEINYVRKYVYLQELRFQNKFKDSYDIEEDLYSAPILKLSFQPIVENCIYHGLLNREGLGTISIKGRKRGRNMEFTISDNGIGMSQEKADAILYPPAQEDIYEASDETENIALWNINQRIKRKYGEIYGLSIQSQPGEGTVVTMRIPLMDAEEGAL